MSCDLQVKAKLARMRNSSLFTFISLVEGPITVPAGYRTESAVSSLVGVGREARLSTLVAQHDDILSKNSDSVWPG